MLRNEVVLLQRKTLEFCHLTFAGLADIFNLKNELNLHIKYRNIILYEIFKTTACWKRKSATPKSLYLRCSSVSKHSSSLS